MLSGIAAAGEDTNKVKLLAGLSGSYSLMSPDDGVMYGLGGTGQ
jgi:hypothetical protein